MNYFGRMKNKKTKGFFDEAFRQEKIAVKDPLTILSTGVNWEQFRGVLEECFKGINYSQGGRPPFDRLMMFKILILQEYYGLSDDQMEFQLLDRLSFQRFIGQGLEDTVPDAKTIWLYRNTLTEAGVIDELFVQLNKQLERTGLIAHKGKMVDASFVKAPIQRNTPEENKKIKQGETPDWAENKARQKDVDADWTKKGGVNYYGYKQHIKADLKSKLITNFEVTPASVHDSQVLEELLEETDKGQPLFLDSAYHKEERIEQLKGMEIKPRIISKSYRNHPLTQKQKDKNRKLSSKRCRVEHIFAWLKQKGGHLIRGIGIERITARVTLRILGYNLSRAVFLLKNRPSKLQFI
jgi:IS5 family transposase